MKKKVRDLTGKWLMVTRRGFLRYLGGTAGACLANSLVMGEQAAEEHASNVIGHWAETSAGLPMYRYTGLLPARALDRTGADAQLVPDPVFLLGNHRITLLAHVSGILQVITGERAWARVNAGDTINSGENSARLTAAGTDYDLVGMQTLAADPSRTERTFGCGFARYSYRLTPKLTANRVISVEPSMAVGDGNAAFVLSVTLENRDDQAVPFEYLESLRNHYVLAGMQKVAPAQRIAEYRSSVTHPTGLRTAFAQTSVVPLQFESPDGVEEAARYDLQPANVYLYSAEAVPGVQQSVNGSNDAALMAQYTGTIPARGTVTFSMVVGVTYGKIADASTQAAALLARGNAATLEDGLFASAWRSRLPKLPQERDAEIRLEMVWNAHALEAMATYSAYFDETFVPQGTYYAYEDGENISNRDNLQAMLPLCYTHPALARSCLRHVLKQTTRTGEIKRGTGGYGYVSPGVFKESDEQLYLFLALGEYLRITGDSKILDETVPYYPHTPGSQATVLHLLEKHFIYLRDEVGVGPNGLIRILNSDWSDSFFQTYSPNVTGSAESHLNSAMALAVLPTLITALRLLKRADAADLIDAMESFRAALHKAYMRDLGTRDFSCRAYLNDHKPRYGVDIVCLEPQAWLLQIPGLPEARKRAIYARVRAATLATEKVGFRIHERPIFGGKGEGEDGGIWFAIEHQMLMAVITFDRTEARRLLRTMSFHNYAEQYPNYTLGRWTNSDGLQSTLSAREGLLNYWFPTFKQSGIGYCSHPHSWPLYNYFRIMEA